MDKEKEIENKLYDFFIDQIYTDREEIEQVQRYEEYLCTMNKGIVIDCTDGTQICLTIHVR